MPGQIINRSTRILLKSLLILAAVLLFLLGLLSVVLNSSGGSNWAVAQLLNRLNAIEGLSVSVANTSGTLLEGLSLQQVRIDQPGVSIQIEDLQASWNPYSLMTGRVIVSQLNINGLSIDLLPSPDPIVPSSPPTATFEFPALPVVIELNQFALQNALLNVNGSSFQIASLRLNAELEQQSLHLENIRLSAENAGVDGSYSIILASPFPMTGDLRWNYQWSEDAPLIPTWLAASGNLQVEGDLVALQIEHQLESPQIISSRGEIQTGLLADSNAELRISLEHAAEQLRLPYAGVEQIAFSAVSLSTSGALNALELELQANALLEQFPPLTMSATAQLLSGQLQLSAIQLATSTGAVMASGALDWRDDFNAAFEFSVDEQNPLAYLSTELPLSLLDLQCSGNVAFSLFEGGRSATLQIDSISGLLANYAMEGSVSLQVQNDVILLEKLQLATADNLLQLTGSLSDRIDLQWEVSAPELQQLIPNAQGSVNASGSVVGNPRSPEIRMHLQGTQLQYQSFAARQLLMDVANTAEEISISATLLDASFGSSDPESQLQEVNLGIAGTVAAHTIHADIQSLYGQLNLAAEGGFNSQPGGSWQGNLLRAELRSEFGDWSTESPAAISYSNESISLANNCWRQAEIQLCLQISGNPAETVSLNSELRNFPLAAFNAAVAGVDAVVTMPALQRLPANTEMAGLLMADLSMQLNSAGIDQINFTAQGEGAELTIRLAEESEDLLAEDIEIAAREQLYKLDELAARGTFAQGRWDLNGNLGFSSENIDDTNLALSGSAQLALGIDENSSLSGNLSAGINDLGWIEAFVPDLTNIEGSLSGQAQIAGSLAAPRLLSTDFIIRDAAFHVAALGSDFNAIQLQMQSSDMNEIHFNATARSNEGSLQLLARVNNPYDPDRRLTGTLSGENFQLINRDELHLTVSPEVTLDVSRLAIQLGGRIDIPELDLQLLALPEAVADVSRDTVIVAYPESRPDLARSVAATENTVFEIPIVTDLTVHLGEQVNFDGFGLLARLSGELNFRQQADGTSLTYGELSIEEGSYKAYSTELDLEYGKLLFFGAYDNPALDIRAVRRVDQLTAGVQMNGTLQNINSQLYSSPALPDNDIIAVLITGKPFSDIGEQDSNALVGAIAGLGLERGQGLTNQVRDKLGLDTLAVSNSGDINDSMLTIGKYLSPTIFIRYGVGLFDNQSTVAIDYLLSERITLQAESGEHQSVDLKYRIER